MTIGISPETAYLFMLMFARMGTLAMLMPALGERTVPVRMRLVLALAITLLLFPVVATAYPPLPAGLTGVLTVLAGEFAVGFGIGLIARFILSSLQTAGTTIAFQMGLGFAQNIDPTQGAQGALIGNFLTVLAIVLIFTTNLHHLAIAALHDSYALFPPGTVFPAGDFATAALMALTEAFVIGIQLAGPFLVFGLIFYLGLGVLSRLMPQLQIFFIAMPANIMIGLALMMLLIASVMAWYLGYVETALMRFIAG